MVESANIAGERFPTTPESRKTPTAKEAPGLSSRSTKANANQSSFDSQPAVVNCILASA